MKKYQCELTTHGTTNMIESNNLSEIKTRLRRCEKAEAVVYNTKSETTEKYIIKDYRIVDSYEWI